MQGGHAGEKAPVRKEMSTTLASAKEADKADETDCLSKDKAAADDAAVVLTALHITEGPTTDDKANGAYPLLPLSCEFLHTTRYWHTQLRLCTHACNNTHGEKH